jgi:hypothetical protein
MVFLVIIALLVLVSVQRPVLAQDQEAVIVLRTDPAIASVKFWINSTIYITNSSGIVQVLVAPGFYVIETEREFEISSMCRVRFSMWSNGDTNPRLGLSVDTRSELIGRFAVMYGLQVSITPPPVVPAPGVFPEFEWIDANASVEISSPYSWNEIPSEKRINLVEYVLDGLRFPVPERRSDGIFHLTLTMDRPHIVSFSGVSQDSVTIRSGSNIGVSPQSPTGDFWFDEGTLIFISTDRVWDVTPEQSRKNLVSWSINAGSIQQLERLSYERFQMPVTVDRPLTLEFAWTTQFFLEVQGGGNVTYSHESQTKDRWYDEGSSLVVSTDCVWDSVPGTQRKNLIAWIMDGTERPVQRESGGRYVTPLIRMDRFHALTFKGVKQFLVTVLTHISTTSQSGSQTSDGWYDEDSFASISVETPYPVTSEHRFVFTRWIPSTQIASFNTTLPSARFRVTNPVIIEAEWAEQWLIRVSYEPQDFPLPTTHLWAENGKVSTLGLDRIVKMNETTRFVLHHWTVDDTSHVENDILVVPVSPLQVDVVYVKEYLVSLVAKELPSGVRPHVTLLFGNGTKLEDELPFRAWVPADTLTSFSVEYMIWINPFVAYEMVSPPLAPLIVKGPQDLHVTYARFDIVAILSLAVAVFGLFNLYFAVKNYRLRRTLGKVTETEAVRNVQIVVGPTSQGHCFDLES